MLNYHEHGDHKIFSRAVFFKFSYIHVLANFYYSASFFIYRVYLAPTNGLYV